MPPRSKRAFLVDSPNGTPVAVVSNHSAVQQKTITGKAAQPIEAHKCQKETMMKAVDSPVHIKNTHVHPLPAKPHIKQTL